MRWASGLSGDPVLWVLSTFGVAVVGLLGWIAWLVFNAWLFARTGDPDSFEKASVVARSFRRSSMADAVKELRSTAERGRVKAKGQDSSAV